jgi:hypothetical protein
MGYSQKFLTDNQTFRKRFFEKHTEKTIFAACYAKTFTHIRFGASVPHFGCGHYTAGSTARAVFYG